MEDIPSEIHSLKKYINLEWDKSVYLKNLEKINREEKISWDSLVINDSIDIMILKNNIEFKETSYISETHDVLQFNNIKLSNKIIDFLVSCNIEGIPYHLSLVKIEYKLAFSKICKATSKSRCLGAYSFPLDGDILFRPQTTFYNIVTTCKYIFNKSADNRPLLVFGFSLLSVSTLMKIQKDFMSVFNNKEKMVTKINMCEKNYIRSNVLVDTFFDSIDKNNPKIYEYISTTDLSIPIKSEYYYHLLTSIYCLMIMVISFYNETLNKNNFNKKKKKKRRNRNRRKKSQQIIGNVIDNKQSSIKSDQKHFAQVLALASPVEKAKMIQQILKETTGNECMICFTLSQNKVKFSCDHFVCMTCGMKLKEYGYKDCIICHRTD